MFPFPAFLPFHKNVRFKFKTVIQSFWAGEISISRFNSNIWLLTYIHQRFEKQELQKISTLIWQAVKWLWA